MKRLLVAAAAVLSMYAFAGDKTHPAEHHAQQSEVKWVQPFGAQGPYFGFVRGKMGDKKPASFFVKFPAGGDSGWHVHDEDYEAVVVKGTFTEQQQGEASETLLPTGTYFFQPGKKTHRNGCAKGEDCLVYVHFDKGASSHMTTADGKRLPENASAMK